MAIDRRSLLIGAAGAIVGATHAAHAAAPASLFASARQGRDGSYAAAIIDDSGRDIRAVALPGRGHDVAFCPATQCCVAFARRPGTFAVAFSAVSDVAPVVFQTRPDRHFYGHGLFSRDGRLLYATENDFETACGVIGVYDATGAFRRIGEFPSHGVGPHDLGMLAGDEVMVVANGGLKEHPDIGGGRRVLNPTDIATSLAYINCTTGDLLERHELGSAAMLSLRHLAIGGTDTVVIGAQFMGPSQMPRSVLMQHRRQSGLAAIDLPHAIQECLAGYVSSVAVDAGRSVVAVTSSRGGNIVLLDLDGWRPLHALPVADVSGIAADATARTFLVSSGDGIVTHACATDTQAGPASVTPWRWDNHLTPCLQRRGTGRPLTGR